LLALNEQPDPKEIKTSVNYICNNDLLTKLLMNIPIKKRDVESIKTRELNLLV